MYTAYLIGRFLAHVEILERDRAPLDFRFSAADSILGHILGRDHRAPRSVLNTRH